MVLTLGHCAPHIPSQWPMLLREYQVGANNPGPFFLALSITDLPRLLIIAGSCVIPFFMAGLDAVPHAAALFGRFFLFHFLLVVGASSVSYFGTSCSSIPVIGFVIGKRRFFPSIAVVVVVCCRRCARWRFLTHAPTHP